MSNSFLIFSQRAQSNIHNLALKAKKNNLSFRPHFKTHQNLLVGNWFRQEGVNKITVSSVKMAQFFMADGWNDITIAFPIDINEIDEIDEMAAQISIHVLVSNKEHLQYLHKLKNRVGVMIEIDVGYHRSGIWFEDLKMIKEIIRKILRQHSVHFRGLLAHFGNSYQSRNRDQILDVANKSIHRLLLLKNNIANEMGINVFVSIGDTPTASVMETIEGVDELRPGNFVFYDLMQLQIGSCELQHIAAVMRCAIVDKKVDKKQIIIHGGAVHFSKEYIDIGDLKSFGQLVNTSGKQWQLLASHLVSLSQEHGIIQCANGDFNKYKIGDYVDIIPVHSCLTANLMKNKFQIV